MYHNLEATSSKSENGRNLANFNEKKRKEKCKANLDTTLAKPTSKKKSAEKQSLISKESKLNMMTNGIDACNNSNSKKEDEIEANESGPKKNTELKHARTLVSLHRNKVDVILHPILWTAFYENMIKLGRDDHSSNSKKIHPMISRSKLKIMYNNYLKVMSEDEVSKYRIMLKSSKRVDSMTNVYDFHKSNINENSQNKKEDKDIDVKETKSWWEVIRSIAPGM